MSKKTKNKKGIVYSTDPDFAYDRENNDQVETLPPVKQNLRMRLDRLKGNKRTTVIYDFVGSDDDFKQLGKSLKDKCGCGGTVKNGEILLQGDFRDRVGQELTALGYRFKMVGG
jgi:translation initiation factor 1